MGVLHGRRYRRGHGDLGGDSWRTGGGGGWMPGTYDPETNSVWWGTANPAPLYDWSGADWKKSGPRPGTNLYTTSVIALDPDTGKLKFHHQELPHDAWDFDSSVGEFVMIERGGKKLVVHANKSGYVFVYDRSNAKVENVWPLVKNINFVKSIDPKTGELIGRRDLVEGKVDPPLCPAIAGGISWNSGAYSPKNGLFYRIGQEWCMEMSVEKTTPILEPMAQLNIGATFKIVAPPDGRPAVISAPAIRSPAPRSGRSTTSSRRSPAFLPLRAIWYSCRTPKASCTPTMRTPATSCGRATTAWDIMPASSATWPAASSTSPYPRAGAAWWPMSMSRSTASPSRACRRIPVPWLSSLRQ